MGFEYRVFYVGDVREAFEAHAKEVFPALEKKDEAPEDRTDVYLSCREDIGAKARGGLEEGIELKRRTQKKKRGAEEWSKELVPKPEGSEALTVLESVKAILREIEIEVLDWSLAQEIKLRKVRQMYKVADEAMAKVKVECTLVEDLEAGCVYTSVCVEHKKDPQRIYTAIEALKLETFHAASLLPGYASGTGDEWMGSAVVSYPAFSLHLARLRAASN